MINIYNNLKREFLESYKKILFKNNINFDESDYEKFSIESIKDRKNGHVACNIAMVFKNKFINTNLANPINLAKEIVNNISSEYIAKIEVAGPGFINIHLNNEIFYNILKDLLICKEFKFPNLGKNLKINLEYASPNPTGPIHIGHTRGAIYGDVLANLLSKFGYEVTKEYYINDAGVQITNLLKSAFLRYLELLGKEINLDQENFYPGEYLIEAAKIIKDKFGEKLVNLEESEYIPLIREIVLNYTLNLIITDLKTLGIEHNSYISEKKELHDTDAIKEAIEILYQNNLIYRGKLELPKTEKGVGDKTRNLSKVLPEDYDEEEQTLFKSTLFGDDQDRVIIKNDGSYTYFAADIAYSLNKIKRGAKLLIMPLGFDHAGYVKRLSAIVKFFSNDEVKLKVILCQMVKFVKNGQPLKMSKRSGNFITAKDVVDEVGADALRFIMLTRKNDAPFDFDLAKVIEFSNDNPIFYVQYAHARCCSIIRNAQNEEIIKKLFYNNELDYNLINFEYLKQELEIEIIHKIAFFPKLLEISVQNLEPHKIAFYLQELAALLHNLWSKGNEDSNLKFIQKDNINLTLARLGLIFGVKKIIATALEIFNIKPIQEMK